MLKLVSKQKNANGDQEGKLLFNGTIELTFQTFKDKWGSGLTVYFNDAAVGGEVESVDGVDGWDIVDAAIDVIE